MLLSTRLLSPALLFVNTLNAAAAPTPSSQPVDLAEDNCDSSSDVQNPTRTF